METLESQKCFFSKGRTGGSEEEKEEEMVNKPVRTMPKKSRNPFLSEKYVQIPSGLGCSALEADGCSAVRCCPGRAGRGRWRSAVRTPRSAPAAPGTAREEGGLRSHLLASPSSRHIPQPAELEGQRLLKLKAQAFSTFFNIQVLQLP